MNNWYGGGKWYDYTLGKKKCITTGGTERDPAGLYVTGVSKYTVGTVATGTCATGPFDKEF